jgi:hypothetical protein
VRGVAQRVGRPAVGRVADAQPEHAVVLPHPLGRRPGAVVVLDFQRTEQPRTRRRRGAGAAAGEHGRQGRRTGQHHAAIAVVPARQVQKPVVQSILVLDACRAHGREVAVLGEIRPLAVLDLVDQLGNEEIQVGVALAMRVGRHVDRQALHPGGEVGAVVEVVAAQEVLVGLAVAGMLRDDEARHRLKHLAGTQQRQVGQPLAADGALRGGIRRADAVVVVAGHLHVLHAGGRLRRRGLRRRRRLRARKRPPHAEDGSDQCFLVMTVHGVSARWSRHPCGCPPAKVL